MQDNKTANSPQKELPLQTYADLDAAYIANLQSSNKSEQDVKNFRSLLSSWQRVFKVDSNSKIESHFGNNFSACLEKYKDSEAKNDVKSSTLASKISRLKSINSFIKEQVVLQNLPDNFGDRLIYLVISKGYKIWSFWHTHLKGKIAHSTFSNWWKGQLPTERLYPVINEIESILQVAKGTLSSLLRVPNLSKKDSRRISAFSEKMRELSSKPYGVWNDAVEEEFNGLTKFMSDPVVPEGFNRSNTAGWTSSEGTVLPTAGMAKETLKQFFGFCCLEKDNPDPHLRGLGLSLDDMTIGLLTSKEIVEEYITTFRKARSGGKYNNGHLNFLNFAISLLRPQTGYLYQKPEFALKLGLSGSVDEWQKRCINTRNRLQNVCNDIERAEKSGSDEYAKGRDPYDAISEILDLPSPVSYLTELLNKMLVDFEKQTSLETRAVLYRDILLFALLMANPLRVRMFSIMKFDRNLLRQEDGSWWIAFKREDFKNRHSIKGDYKVRVAPEIIPLIERYRAEFREVFVGAKESDYVFLGLPSNGNERKTSRNLYQYTEGNLAERIFHITRKYDPISPGFRPHAFRHLITTSIIKNNPEMGFFLASKVLYDKLETVENNYHHLKTTEFFEPYNRYVSGFFSTVISPSGQSISVTAKNGGNGK
jgi:integrase